MDDHRPTDDEQVSHTPPQVPPGWPVPPPGTPMPPSTAPSAGAPASHDAPPTPGVPSPAGAPASPSGTTPPTGTPPTGTPPTGPAVHPGGAPYPGATPGHRPDWPYGSAPPPSGPGAPPYGSVPPYGSGPPYGGGVPPYGWSWTPAPAPRPARAALAAVVAVCVLLAAAVGGVVGHQIWRAAQNPTSSNTNPFGTLAPSGGQGNSNGSGPEDSGSIASHVDPGLVDVNTQIDSQGLEGAGTGMVLTSNGEVLTNNHVIEGATRISVTDVGNGRTYVGQVVGYDRTHDVAVLQLVGASGLQTVQTGDSSKVNVGQGVVAIGNANGTGGTPSYAGGTITALGQTITARDDADGSSEQLTGLMATNADIVSGDSGGPLVDSSGHVIGIDTAASSGYQFQGGSNQGYAIPINTALSIARQIESGNGSSTVHLGSTALLGVEVSPGNDAFGFGGSSQSGADVVGLLADSPAANAGIVAGDVITSVAGHTITSGDSLTNTMLGLRPGQTVSVGYTDTSGQNQTTSVTLIAGPPQ